MTRMGLHIHSTRQTPMVREYCRNVRPAVVKSLVADRALFEAIKAESPHTRIVYRHYWADQRFETHSAYIAAVRDALGPVKGLVSWAEGWNEFTARDPREQRRFAEHEVRFAQSMLDYGVGAAIGGYSTGFLDSSGPMYEAARPILEQCHAHPGVVVWHSHEYAAPYMQYMTRTTDDRNQWKAGWTGYSNDDRQYWREDLDGWLCLRYRMLWKQLQRDGLTGVRMILSETGIDDVNPRPGPQGKGWRDFQGAEWTRTGDYADQQRWYGWHISHDHYVLGWVDFGFATEDRAWNSFDLAQDRRMFDRVMGEQVKLADGFIGSPSAPPPVTPPVTPVTPPVPTGVAELVPVVQVPLGVKSWWQMLRLLGVPANTANASALMAANPGTLTEGLWLRSPFHKVVTK